MKLIKKVRLKKGGGAALIISMIFVLVVSTLAVSLATISGTNLQLADNQHKVNSALAAAESGLECGKYVAANTPLPSTGYNFVTEYEADQAWDALCAHVQAQPWVNGQAVETANEILTPPANFGRDNVAFRVRFYREGTHIIRLEGIGVDGPVTKRVSINMKITKDSKVLNYAIASRGRMWVTGDSTIHGDVFSSWDRPEISPFNMTSDTTVLGTINTVLTLEQLENQSYQMETLDEHGNPIDIEGNPLGTNYEDRYHSEDDEVKAYHEGINYGQPYENMPGMDIADYDTDMYEDFVMNEGNGNIPASSMIEREYFPHAAGNYNQPKYSSSRTLDRHVYENQTLTDVRLPDNRNALFRNCTFEGILYIDCYKSTSSYYNNVRFENCTFNGVIVTDVPQQLKWKHNCLYFTGEATFNNQSDVQEATILAPHFNVNLGNTNPLQSDNNVLTGAIVGGIVDVRGNAQIYGTIISMCDTTQWSSGYVTNIGATLDDGGSETTELGDIGVIDITPEEDKMLPSGITSPIVIKPLSQTYSENP